MEAYKVDSLIDALGDLLNELIKIRWETDPEKQKAFLMDFSSGYLPKWLAAIEKRKASNPNPNFLVGESATIADFAFAGMIFTAFYNEVNPMTVVLKNVYD